MSGREQGPPCDPRLDSELELLFSPEGASIKSALRLSAAPTTDPAALCVVDHRVESSKLLEGLLRAEFDALRNYYIWRSTADRLTAISRMARNEARGYRRRRSFKSGIAEVQRRYRERKKARSGGP